MKEGPLFQLLQYIYVKNLLVINYSFWGSVSCRILANLSELCALQDLSHISIPLQLIALFLPRSQVTAHKTKARLVQ